MELALGTAQFGMPYGIANHNGRPSNIEVAKIVATAEAAGIALLDTAVAYGDSQSVLGGIRVNDWKVVSKLPPLPAQHRDVNAWVNQLMRESLYQLQVDKLYGLLLHRPADLLGDQGSALARALTNLKKTGKVDKIGVSVYAPDILSNVRSVMQIDLVQAPFNVIDRRLHASGWLQRLGDEGVEVHVRSVFLQGLLLMDDSERHNRFSKWNHLWQKWRVWRDANEVSAIEACLGFVREFPHIDKVVVGVDRAEQLQDLLNAFSKRVPPVPKDLACTDLALIDPSRWNDE